LVFANFVAAPILLHACGRGAGDLAGGEGDAQRGGFVDLRCLQTRGGNGRDVFDDAQQRAIAADRRFDVRAIHREAADFLLHAQLADALVVGRIRTHAQGVDGTGTVTFPAQEVRDDGRRRGLRRRGQRLTMAGAGDVGGGAIIARRRGGGGRLDGEGDGRRQQADRAGRCEDFHAGNSRNDGGNRGGREHLPVLASPDWATGFVRSR
jgi:hypothetical protein